MYLFNADSYCTLYIYSSKLMQIQRETFSECKEELIALTQEHFEELDVLKIPFKPNWTLFGELANTGMLVILTLRKNNILMGYSCSLIEMSMVYSVLTSNCIMLYVDPTLRGSTPLRLMRKTVEYLKSLGACIHTWDVPAKNDFSTILKRQGYTKVETYYMKDLRRK